MKPQALFSQFLIVMTVVVAARADDTATLPAPPVADNEVQTFTPPRDPRLNLVSSIPSMDSVQITWQNKRNVPFTYGVFGGGPVVALSTEWNVSAGGENRYQGKVGQAIIFRTREQSSRPATSGYNTCIDGVLMIVPDNQSHLPQSQEFDAVQTLQIPADSYDDYFKFTFADGKGTISCMNYRATGTGTAWRKESQQKGETIVEYYVQIADTNAAPSAETGRFKVLRNLTNRHTIRLHTDNTSEQAMPGDTDWRPYDTGRWSIPR